jgi:hypothetical protein
VSNPNQKRYRGRTRSTIRSAGRHLQNLINQSKAASVRCLLIPAIDAGNAYPTSLLDGNVQASLQSTVALLANLLSQKRSAGPTCLSAGFFAP